MTTGGTGGAPGSPPGASPVGSGGSGGPGGLDREALREARKRTDRVYGGSLLAVGVVATIISMSAFTENALAIQFATLFEQYGLQHYTRPPVLAGLSLTGIIGMPVIYATTLYLALLRWRAGKFGSWIVFLGAALAFGFTAALMFVGVAMHPQLLELATTPTPTP